MSLYMWIPRQSSCSLKICGNLKPQVVGSAPISDSPHLACSVTWVF